jgi:WD40 repeat protein/LysM repeat protein
VVAAAFNDALRHLDRFRGEVSLRGWIFRITIQQTARYKRKWRRRLLDPIQADDPLSSMAAGYWASFDDLPEKYRLVLILSAVFGLTIDDLAAILHLRAKHAHRLLVTARKRLMLKPHPSHRAGQIESYLDGLLTNEAGARDALESHLPECQTCDAYLRQLRALDQQLKDGLQQRWPPRLLSTIESEQLVESIAAELSHQPAGHLPRISLRKLAWTAGMLLVFAFSALFMIIQQPQLLEFAPRPTLTPTVPPPVVEPDLSLKSEGQVNSPSGVLMYTYDLSGDGSSFVLVSSSIGMESVEDTSLSQHVYLYDRVQDGLLEVSQSQELLNFNNWMNSPPSLSADGRFVAYSQSKAQPDDPGGFCLTEDGFPCADVYIFDRQSGVTEQVTQGLDGAAADGTSFGVSLSADGRWVAFWSMASNLSPDDSGPCNPLAEELQPCMDIFLVDWQAGTTIRIPIGSYPYNGSISPDGISLSADGSLVGFTVNANNSLATQLDLPSKPQAVLYDRQSASYELVLAADGTPGNAASFGPELSADGRFVAFTSHASNLVEGDTNEVADVFVLDRQTGDIERVSLGRYGEQGTSDSGVLMDSTGFYSLDMSGDGRYIVFLSTVGNLGTSSNCAEEMYCNLVVLHDRLSGTSEIIQPLQNPLFFLFPKVSDDGRWVSYMEINMGCVATQGLCMDLSLFDRQRGWTNRMVDDIFHPVVNEWQAGPLIEAAASEVELLSVSPDGKYLAVSYLDQSIGLWSFELEKWVLSLIASPGNSITSLSFSPDGSRLAAGTRDGIVHIWAIPDGRHLFVLDNHPGRVHTVLFSPDGNELLVGTPNAVWVWRRGEGNIQRVNVLEYPDEINSMALAPSGNLLAVAHTDHTVWLQLLPSGTLLTRLGGQDSSVSEVSFSPDGNWLASRAQAGEVNLWKIGWQGFGALQAEFVSSFNDSMLFGNLVFSPDSQYLISGSMYSGIVLWDVESNRITNLYSSERGESMIKTVAFSADGSTVLAGLFGAVDTWSSHQAVKNPRFFQPYASDKFNALIAGGYQPMPDWPDAFRTGDVIGPHLNLYQAEELLSFDLLVPAHLPEQVRFVEAQLLDDGDVALRYQVTGPGGSAAEMLILEHASSFGSSALPVGEDSVVEQIDLESVSAEYIQGDWKPQDSWVWDSSWQWDETQPVQRLRWQQILDIEIFYRELSNPIEVESGTTLESPSQNEMLQPNFILNKADLQQIARGLVPLPEFLPRNTKQATYTVQEGDTCSGIATAFGSSVEAIVSLNGLPADCNLIHVGDVFTIPMSTLRVDLAAQADQGCDGRLVHLQAVAAPVISTNFIGYSIFLRALSDMGTYQDVWSTSAAAEEGDYLTNPLLIELGECQSFVAYAVLRGEQEHLRIHHWLDGQMQLVLDQGVKLMSVDAASDRLVVLEHVVDPAGSTCQVWLVTYQWNGESLEEVERVPDPSLWCAP